MGVSLVSLISFFFTIYTVNKALQFRKSVLEAEGKVLDLIDEALQIMIPAGICKHICNPDLNLSVDRADSKEQVRKQGHNAQQPEYPEEVSIALRNEDELYDLFGERKEEENVKVEIRKAVNLAVKGIKKRSEIIVRMSPSKSAVKTTNSCQHCHRMKLKSLPTAPTQESEQALKRHIKSFEKLLTEKTCEDGDEK